METSGKMGLAREQVSGREQNRKRKQIMDIDQAKGIGSIPDPIEKFTDKEEKALGTTPASQEKALAAKVSPEGKTPVETTTAIEVIDLKKNFGTFVAVNKISFKVNKGEVFGFLGPNGSGKTTVIRMILGLITPTSGQGKVLGLDVALESRRLRHKIGYMSQKFSLYEELTVEENLDFYAGVYDLSREDRERKKEEILKMANLEGKEKVIVSKLSGGWKQRLALGCSIIHDPEILLLDEPTGGVDPIARRQFWDIIYNLSKSGVTILVTTHYMDEAEHCNTIGFLYYGDILAVDTPKHLKESAIDGDILELKVDQTLAAIEVLKDYPGVESASVYGAGIHVLIKPGTAPLELSTLLENQGIRVEQSRVVAPSLEDVFVFLVERERIREKHKQDEIELRKEQEFSDDI